MAESHTLTDLVRQLEARLARLGPIALAFSGGLDSRFLAHTALNAGADIHAVHIAGPHVPGEEEAFCRAWAAERGLPLTVAECDPLSIPEVAAGREDRCYYCKRAIFTAIRRAAPDRIICDGTNASDLSAYRPGLRALSELAVISLMAELGIDKAAIHEMATLTGMDRPDQAARPCLLTRFNYGLSPDKETLARIDAAENAVAAVLARHAAEPPPDYRLRVEAPGAYLLQVALPELPDSLRHALETILAEHGFAHARILHGPAISGYFDRAAKLA